MIKSVMIAVGNQNIIKHLEAKQEKGSQDKDARIATQYWANSSRSFMLLKTH